MDDQLQSPSRSHSAAEVVGGFALGIGLIVICTFFVKLALATIASISYPGRLAWVAVWLIFGFGVTQLIYMVPAILIARRRGHIGIAKGLIIAASLAFLLNASCFVLFWSGKMGRIGG